MSAVWEDPGQLDLTAGIDRRVSGVLSGPPARRAPADAVESLEVLAAWGRAPELPDVSVGLWAAVVSDVAVVLAWAAAELDAPGF